MLHPDTEVRFINDKVGYGVVATKLIPKGTITWVQDELDQIFSPQKVAALSPLIQEYLETYGFTIANGDRVLCWDNAKFINHSFNSSCVSTAYDFEIAVRDIQPGEQLTDDYGYLNVSEPFIAVDEGTERKTVYPDDLLHYHKIWDNQVRERFQDIQRVEQPLLKFISSEHWRDFQAAMHGKAELRSLLTCYYDQQGANLDLGVAPPR